MIDPNTAQILQERIDVEIANITKGIVKATPTESESKDLADLWHKRGQIRALERFRDQLINKDE